MRSSFLPFVALVALLLFTRGVAIAESRQAMDTAILKVNIRDVKETVSPNFYGLMTEEINHSYDGGLYAELIQNRCFQDDPKAPLHWTGYPGTELALVHDQPINPTLTTCLEASSRQTGKAGVSNDGFWGIPYYPGWIYHVSFYAKSRGVFNGAISVSIQKQNQIMVKTSVAHVSTHWKKYTCELAAPSGAEASASDATFKLSWNGQAVLDFNLVSVFPPTLNGHPFRTDLMQLLKDLSPKFLRLPGGNFLEGDYFADRFNWKKTIGPIEQRAGHPGCWNYRASDGMGLYEFMEWCEDLHVEPLLAVYAGYSLKHEFVASGSKLEPLVQDALDEIEYVAGDPSTKWGSRRAADGHPAPFPLNYVEIGNEDKYDTSRSYDGRFAQFFDAIRRKYPQLQIIATTSVHSRIPDLVDDHFYRSAIDMEKDDAHYDHQSRIGPKVFVGEWATREGSPTTNFNAALGDACWMIMMERNSDLILLNSYAPLLCNINPGAFEWENNLIGYNDVSAFGSPSYYAQKLFSAHLGDVVLNESLTQSPPDLTAKIIKKNKKGQVETNLVTLHALHEVITRDTVRHQLFIKWVNLASTPQTLEVRVEGGSSLTPQGKAFFLSARDGKETNDINHPIRIVPDSKDFKLSKDEFSYALPAQSIGLFIIHYH